MPDIGDESHLWRMLRVLLREIENRLEEATLTEIRDPFNILNPFAHLLHIKHEGCASIIYFKCSIITVF